jgi:hypothetical protein
MIDSIQKHKIEYATQNQADCLLKGDFKPEDFIIKDKPKEDSPNIDEKPCEKYYFENKYFALGQFVISGYMKE